MNAHDKRTAEEIIGNATNAKLIIVPTGGCNKEYVLYLENDCNIYRACGDFGISFEDGEAYYRVTDSDAEQSTVDLILAAFETDNAVEWIWANEGESAEDAMARYLERN